MLLTRTMATGLGLSKREEPDLNPPECSYKALPCAVRSPVSCDRRKSCSNVHGPPLQDRQAAARTLDSLVCLTDFTVSLWTRFAAFHAAAAVRAPGTLCLDTQSASDGCGRPSTGGITNVRVLLTLIDPEQLYA